MNKKNGLYKDDWPWFEKILGKIRYMKIKKYVLSDSICCDVGCGYHGAFLKSIAAKIKYGYGFDYKANPEKSGNIEIINNRGMKLFPIKTETCDRVFLLAVLEHLSNPDSMVTEIHRILNRGGVFVLTTPTPAAKPILEFLSFKLHLISRASIEEHKHYYRKREILDLLLEHGFEDIQYKYFTFGLNSIAIGKKR